MAKPDPDAFTAACARLAVAPQAAVYVGDRLDVDARAATAAGLRGVWLDRTGDGAAVTPYGVVRISTLDELLPLVTQGGSEGPVRTGSLADPRTQSGDGGAVVELPGARVLRWVVR